MSTDFKKLIDQAVQKHGLPPEWRDIGYRQMMAESGGDAAAVSPKGAQGPWQFMPKTAQGYGLTNPNDPAASTDAWGKMMADMLKQTGGNPAHALAAYNWGIGNLQKHGYDAAPAETRDYISKIMGGSVPGMSAAVATPKVYAPAVNGIGAQDAQEAIAPTRNSQQAPTIPDEALMAGVYMPSDVKVYGVA